MSNKKVVVKLDSKGVQEVLKSSEVVSLLQSHAQTITMQCGEGYNYETKTYKKRSAVNIFPETEEARKDNWENHTLTRFV